MSHPGESGGLLIHLGGSSRQSLHDGDEHPSHESTAYPRVFIYRRRDPVGGEDQQALSPGGEEGEGEGALVSERGALGIGGGGVPATSLRSYPKHSTMPTRHGALGRLVAQASQVYVVGTPLTTVCHILEN